MVVHTEPTDSVRCRGLKTNARRGQPGQRCRAGYDTAFVASELHSKLVLDRPFGDFGSLHGQGQSLRLVVVLDVQTEVVDKQRWLHRGTDGRDAEKARTKSEP
jgi:hypothetical protein